MCRLRSWKAFGLESLCSSSWMGRWPPSVVTSRRIRGRTFLVQLRNVINTYFPARVHCLFAVPGLVVLSSSGLFRFRASPRSLLCGLVRSCFGSVRVGLAHARLSAGYCAACVLQRSRASPCPRDACYCALLACGASLHVPLSVSSFVGCFLPLTALIYPAWASSWALRIICCWVWCVISGALELLCCSFSVGWRFASHKLSNVTSVSVAWRRDDGNEAMFWFVALVVSFRS